MGWTDYNVGNLSAMESGVVEVTMKQIIEEKNAVNIDGCDKDEEKAQLSYSDTSVFSGSISNVLKPSKKSKVMSSNGNKNALILSNEDVRCGYFLLFLKNNIFLTV